MPDLIEQATLIAMLADNGLSANQTALLPTIASAASGKIRTWCNRYFNQRTAIDELYTVGRKQPLILNELPVNSIVRLATNPTPVIGITNTDSATNQRALVKLTTSGDVGAGLTITGVTLTRVASGVTTTSNLVFATYTTIQALGSAINALGNGWSATVDIQYALWPTADLRAVQGNLPALGTDANLIIHVDDLSYTLDEVGGVVYFDDLSSSRLDTTRWGPQVFSDFGDTTISRAPLSIRCVYDAGFATVPFEVQEATAELVWDMLNTLQLNTRIVSESLGEYSYNQAGIDRVGISNTVLVKLAPYRLTRA